LGSNNVLGNSISCSTVQQPCLSKQSHKNPADYPSTLSGSVKIRHCQRFEHATLIEQLLDVVQRDEFSMGFDTTQRKLLPAWKSSYSQERRISDRHKLISGSKTAQLEKCKIRLEALLQTVYFDVDVSHGRILRSIRQTELLYFPFLFFFFHSMRSKQTRACFFMQSCD
jgi:hypothetical protein